MKKATTTFIALTAGLFAAGAANAATFTFTEGFGGGTVSGSFTGVDANHDDFLDESELSAFSFTYPENSSIPTTTFGLSDVVDFGFNLAGDLLLGADPGEGMILGGGTNLQSDGFAEGVLYAPGCGSCAVFFHVTGPNFALGDGSSQQIVVTSEVPLPAALPLFMAGLAGLGFSFRSKTKAARGRPMEA